MEQNYYPWFALPIERTAKQYDEKPPSSDPIFLRERKERKPPTREREFIFPIDKDKSYELLAQVLEKYPNLKDEFEDFNVSYLCIKLVSYKPIENEPDNR